MRIRRVMLLWFILGAAYTVIEILWRGYTHPAMLIVGGLCGVLVGAVNQHPRFYNMKVIWQSCIGAVIVLCVEFIAGCILNLELGLDIWDYTNLPFNILGQICLLFGKLWLLIMPFAIWLEDTLRWILYWYHTGTCKKCSEEPPEIALYTLKSIYIEFFTGN